MTCLDNNFVIKLKYYCHYVLFFTHFCSSLLYNFTVTFVNWYVLWNFVVLCTGYKSFKGLYLSLVVFIHNYDPCLFATSFLMISLKTHIWLHLTIQQWLGVWKTGLHHNQHLLLQIKVIEIIYAVHNIYNCHDILRILHPWPLFSNVHLLLPHISWFP